MHNFRARFYDSDLGIFYATDPAGQGFASYAYAGNNPVIYVDKDGRWFGVDDLIAGVIGGTINLTVNLIQGNIDNFGEGLAAFGAGAVQGTATLYGPAAWAASGALVGATNSAISQMTSWDQFGDLNWQVIGTSAVSSGAASIAGGAFGKLGASAGKWAIQGLEISSPIVNGAITGGLAGSFAGFGGGFTTGYIMTGNLEKAWNYGVKGSISGSILGTVSGAGQGYKYARDNNLDYWTGKPNSSYGSLVEKSRGIYPNKAGRIENHHITPKYLGGAKNGPTVPLNGSYHQMITNEFRSLWPYGYPNPSAQQLQLIMKEVYGKFPLPPGY